MCGDASTGEEHFGTKILFLGIASHVDGRGLGGGSTGRSDTPPARLYQCNRTNRTSHRGENGCRGEEGKINAKKEMDHCGDCDSDSGCHCRGPFTFARNKKIKLGVLNFPVFGTGLLINPGSGFKTGSTL